MVYGLAVVGVVLGVLAHWEISKLQDENAKLRGALEPLLRTAAEQQKENERLGEAVMARSAGP